MRSTYKQFVWRAARPVNMVDCMTEWRYFLKYNRNVSIKIHFKQYLHSFIQSVMFTGRVARQTNRFYVLRMIVKLAYSRVLGTSMGVFGGLTDRVGDLFNFFVRPLSKLCVSDAHFRVREKHVLRSRIA